MSGLNLQYSGEEAIPAGLDLVWTFVTDLDRVGHCFPDVVAVTVQDETHLQVVVKVGVGPVRGKFKLKVELLADSSKHRIDMKLAGGGFGSTVDLTAGADIVGAGDGATLLKWGGQAEARGPIAAVGGRVLDAQAKKLIAQAFGNVHKQMTAPQTPRVTLRERFFPLHQPAEVEGVLGGFPWCAIFKAGTSDKTFDAWLVVQHVMEPRVDVAVGFIRLPEDRPASDLVTTLSGIAHRSPQFILFHESKACFHLDEFAIAPDQLVPLLSEHLPPEVGPPVRNEAAVTIDPYRKLLDEYVSGRLPEERFEWAYLDRLEQDARWRDDDTFELLNSLFEHSSGRDVRAARLIAAEFQGQLAGRLEPLKTRAARMLERLADR